MKVEQKRLSPTERVFYFADSLPVIGTFYTNQAKNPPHQLLHAVYQTGCAASLLLTRDFLYLESTTPENLEDLALLALAETDDYLQTAPTIATADEDDIEQKIRLILKIAIAPYLQHDGGDIEFVSVNDHIVKVRFLGKCHGCPYAQRTLKERVEKNLIRYLPNIKEAVLI